jgi:hypothetical protein
VTSTPAPVAAPDEQDEPEAELPATSPPKDAQVDPHPTRFKKIRQAARRRDFQGDLVGDEDVDGLDRQA